MTGQRGGGCRWLVVGVLGSLVAAPSASADFFATFDHGTTGPQGLRAVNATTGATVALPSGVDDPQASEFHVSLSPDRKYMVFSRHHGQTVRIVMVERSTGRFADLFNAFEAQADRPFTPTFSRDGTKVLTGRRLDRLDPLSPPGVVQSSVTETDVTRFPTGPFPHRVVAAGGVDSDRVGRTLQPAPFGSSLLAFGIEYDSGSPPGRITVQGTTLAASTRRLANPTISESAGVVVFESAVFSNPSANKLVFRPLAGIATAQTTDLPAVVNAPNTAARNPAFTRDGRYLAFIRRTSTGVARLYLWDTQTQQLLNPDGISAGPFVTVSGPHPTDGGIALEARPVFTTTNVTSGSTSFSTTQASSTGLFVQRIVGRHKLLGRTAPKLKPVGRVPLGSFRPGRHRVRWTFAVGGRKLGPGCYLVSVRALTRRRHVRDLSTPYTVRIATHRRPLVQKGIRLRTCRRTR